MAGGFKLADAYIDVAAKVNAGKIRTEIDRGLKGTKANLDVKPTVDGRKVKAEVDKGLKGSKDSGKQAGQNIGNSMVKGFATIWAGGMVIDQIKQTVGAGSDLNETVSKSDVVFGKSAAGIHSWAKGAESSMGLSQEAAESNANALGLMFTQVGFSDAGAAKMSKSWTQLAVDLGSFNNADPTAILEAMSAATRGEYDSLQAFVPMINAATVETKALALSGKANADQLTAQDKALAINALMFEQTGKAQGDFARTQDSVANQTKIAQAQIENLRAELGGALLPAVGSAAKAFTGSLVPGIKGTVSAVQALPAPLQGALSGLAGFAGVALTAVAAMYGISKARGKVTETFDEMGIKGGKAATALKMVGVAAAVVTVANAADALGDSMRGLDTNATELARSFRDWQSEGKMSGELLKLVGTDFEGVGKAAEVAHRGGLMGFFDGVDNVTTGLIGVSGVTDDAKKKLELLDQTLVALDPKDAAVLFGDLTKSLQEQGYSVDDINRLFPDYHDKLRTATGATKDAKKPTDDLAVSSTDLAEAVDKETEAYNKYKQTLLDLGLLVLDQRSAQRGYQAALDDATASIKENGKTLDTNTEAGRANQEALDNIADTNLAVVKAARENNASIETQQQLMRDGRKSYIDTAVAMGMPRAAAEALADSIFKIPPTRETHLTAEKAKAETTIAGLKASLKGVTDKKTIAKINADIKEAEQKKRTIDAQLAAIRKARTIAKIDADIRTAQSKKKAIDAELVRLGRLRPTPKVQADIRAAQAKRAQIQREISGLRGKSVAVNVHKNTYDYRYIGTFYTTGKGDKHTGGGSYHGRSALGGWGSQAYARGMADGGFAGWMRGPGTGTSDTAGLVALSNNEFVVRASQAQRLKRAYPGLLEAMNNGTFAPTGHRLDLGSYKGGGGMVIENMTVTIDARSVAEMKSVADFFGRMQQEARRTTRRAG